MRRSWVVLLLLGGCAPGSPPEVETLREAVSTYAVTVSPADVIAGQHYGGEGQEPFVVELTVPSLLRGGGLPPGDIHEGFDDDRSIVQIELPASPFGGSDEDTSDGFANFDEPHFCLVGAIVCPGRNVDGYWRAFQIRNGTVVRELQLARTTKDSFLTTQPLRKIFGVWMPTTQYLWPGDRVRFYYMGTVPRRSTDWTELPLRLHVRFRSGDSTCDPRDPACFTTIADDQVQPLHIHPLPWPSFVRAIAPLDVRAGARFPVVVVVTDFYGNPYRLTGLVRLSGGMTEDLWFADEYRREVPMIYSTPGVYRIVPELMGLSIRSIYHWTVAWSGEPREVRLLGDTHIHTGDGGAGRKFVQTFLPGDHAGLYSRATDALRYLELIVGADFGSVSEHAVRQDAYALPPAVASDDAFEPGGACAGVGSVVEGIDGWWPLVQEAAAEYDGGETGRFVAFPAFEWHSSHDLPGDTSLLHRVVFFRDFDPMHALPILPGDLENVPPQCLIRFLDLAGVGPDQALVIPHMMLAFDGNIDWDLTYGGGGDLAPRALVEEYHRVGEIFSARNYDQFRAHGVPTLVAFEGSNDDPEPWSYRYGWGELGARIGVIGSSDNHSQTPGVDDELTAGGLQYHHHGPGGTAIVLSAARDRDSIYDALAARASYATSGTRAWLDFRIAGAPMGSEIASSAPSLSAGIGLLAGMVITRLELWAAPAGEPGASYSLLLGEYPFSEIALREVTLPNPVPPGSAPAHWLYYVRAFLEPTGDVDGHPEDAVWSSPIWIHWSPGE